MQALLNHITLQGGTLIRSRRIQPNDTTRLALAFSSLSPRSQVLALCLTYRDSSGHSVARFRMSRLLRTCLTIPNAPSPPSAPGFGVVLDAHVVDVEISVVDEFQPRGLGSALVVRLAPPAAHRAESGRSTTSRLCNGLM
jgi:hypothetical protein